MGLLLLGTALLLAVMFHGVLLFGRGFIHTYDALIHIFFGAHYARSWFDPWEPRWYTGFFTIAYPPLSHYLIALASKLVGLLNAFAFAQLFAILQLVVGVFRFSKPLFGARAAGYAALALVLSSSISETIHLFGQLPTILSLGFLLNAIPFIRSYLRSGRTSALIQAVAWTAATTAAHHVTTLFGSVFFTGPIVVIALLGAFRAPRPGEAQGDGLGQRLRRRSYRLLPRLYRTGVFGVLAIISLLVVVLPYWAWSSSDPIIQVPIPHGSREDFLADLNLGLVFWLIPWASTLWALPYALLKGFASWRWPLAASILLLFVLGTGGTTPLPRLLLRGAFDILTLDRFTFWATILILPFVGRLLESLVHGRARAFLDARLGRRVRLGLLLLLTASLCASAVAISTLTRYRKFQPAPIDIDPIVTFIDKDEHWRFRYLTLGFGDQMAWLSANTRATTPDGNYHSARRLPELTTTPIERLEGAKYTGVAGIGSLEQFLALPERYHLKFVFSNDTFYDPLLFFHGWHRLGALENGVVVWEREDIPPLPERLPRRTWPIYQRLMWGVLPMAMPILAYLTLLLVPWGLPSLPWQRSGPGRRLRLALGEDAAPEAAASDWQWWHRPRVRLAARFDARPRAPATRLATTLLLLAAVAAGATALYLRVAEATDTPGNAVVAYWDDMDFKRFEEAYGWLQPADDLDFERWQLDNSVVGGLRSGYAKLDDIRTELLGYEGSGSPGVARVGDRALVRADLTWLTSLREIREVVEHDLVYTAHGWRIAAAPTLAPRAPQRFVSEAALDYYRSPRRLTSDVTDTFDVLDRPTVVLVEARLVSYRVERTPLEREAERVFDPTIVETEQAMVATRYSIVGEVHNSDARPADITITGVLRDRFGIELSRNNAAQHTVHKLLPGERMPFRIDFEGVAALELASATVAAFEVFVKGLVTARDLERDLASWSRPQADDLALTFVNLGTREATIPHAVVALYDDVGVAWVVDGFGLEAVPPRERRDLRIDIGLPEGFATWERVVGPEPLDADVGSAAWPIFPLDRGLLTGYRVHLHAWYRE